MFRNSVIKVLNYVMIGQEGLDNSQKFVDIFGFRIIFFLFMKILIKGRVGLLFVELEGICIKCYKEIYVYLIKY